MFFSNCWTSQSQDSFTVIPKKKMHLSQKQLPQQNDGYLMAVLCISQFPVWLCSDLPTDSSDWQQTDGEEQQSNKNLPRGSEHAETPQPSPKQDAGKLENPSVMPVGRELSPVYIFNNIVLKQVRLVWVQRSKRK